MPALAAGCRLAHERLVREHGANERVPVVPPPEQGASFAADRSTRRTRGDPKRRRAGMAKHLHEIRDPIHGFIRVETPERKILDSRPFQRLRHIHQLAMTSLVYPGAT